MAANFDISFQRVIVMNGNIYFNGIKLPPVPAKNKNLNIINVNDHLYCNGFEWIEGSWRRTLKAFLYMYF